MLSRLLTVIGLSLLSFLATVSAAAPAWAQGRGGDDRDRGPRISLIRDAEIETLLIAYVTPLFRAAGLDASLLRIRLVKDPALNAFVTSGNRMFVHTGLLQKSDSALEVIGVLAHETGHLKNGDPAKLPDMLREAQIKSIGALLIGAAAGIAARDAAPGLAAALGGQSMAMRQMLSFSRAQESGADTISQK